jgi:hypothetical protein
MAYRGQTNSYGDVMKPKLDRCLDLPDLEERLRVERAACQRFREHAPVHLSAVERRYLESRWLELVVMQHYGAPTRLLDWTKSPWVATFFAVSGGWEADGYIYGFRRDLFETQVDDKFQAEVAPFVRGPHRTDMELDPNWDLAKSNDALFQPKTVRDLSEWVATYYCREGNFPRLTAQQGFFTFASRPNVDHWSKITDLDTDSFVVPINQRAKLDILRKLNGVGLNGATLFPGPDGIGRSLEGFVRCWPLDPRPSQF